MIINHEKVHKVIHEIAPFDTSDDWDNVGFLVGNPHAQVNRILLALDVTEQVVEEAIEEGFELIIAHHPLIFKGLKQLTTSNRTGKILTDLIQNQVGVIAAHTNLDKSYSYGLNRYIAEQYGLKDTFVLIEENEDKTIGHGIVGYLSEPLSIEAFSEKTKDIFAQKLLKLVNTHTKPISKVGIVSGAGASYISDAIGQKCDIFITGDLKYHEAQLALGTQTTLMDVGHYESERIYLDYFKRILEEKFEKQDYEVFVKISESEKPIFQWK